MVRLRLMLGWKSMSVWDKSHPWLREVDQFWLPQVYGYISIFSALFSRGQLLWLLVPSLGDKIQPNSSLLSKERMLYKGTMRFFPLVLTTVGMKKEKWEWHNCCFEYVSSYLSMLLYLERVVFIHNWNNFQRNHGYGL